MNKPTEIVKHFLDSHIFHCYEKDISKFKEEIIKELTDVGSIEAEELILFAIKDVNWESLWRSEYQRMVKAEEEAEKNRKDQENLGDIPF